MKNQKLYLLVLQSSAARPQAHDRKWCRPETHFSQTPHRTRLFAGFIVGNQYRATPEPLSRRCENPALPAVGKQFKNPSVLCDFNFFVEEALVVLVGAGEFERVGDGRLTLFHAGDDVGAADPVGLGEVGRRPLGGMVGMGMIEAHDVLAAAPAFALDSHQLPGINVVAVVRGIGSGVAAARSRGHDAGAIVLETP